MRIDQLVLYGLGDDERVRFDAGITVFAGLPPSERTAFIGTVVDALAGRLPNASVIYTDGQDARIYSDRTGASYAESGRPAPAPADILGRDRVALSELLELDGSTLGLGISRSPEAVRKELRAARAGHDELRVSHAELVERAGLVDAWSRDLADLDAAIQQGDDDAARWAWFERRREVDELKAELNLVEQAHDGRSDEQTPAAVDALRSAGASWTDLAAQASALRTDIGEIPDVSDADLARVAATPPEAPAGFATRVDTWQQAADLLHTAKADRQRANAEIPEPDDALIAHFATIDQQALRETHDRLAEAETTFGEQSAAIDHSKLDPETEDRIEAAHLEVVRCQRDVERRFLPGALGVAALAVAALLAGQAVSIIVGVAMLVGAVAMGAWLLIAPRRRLAAATEVELDSLQGADASSWLGLHLRRLEDIGGAGDRKHFERAASERDQARADWHELAGDQAPADFSSRVEDVRAYAEASDPRATQRRRQEAEEFLAAAEQSERAAKQSVSGGLAAYGIAVGDRLEPAELPTMVAARIRAGATARRAKELHRAEHQEAEASRRLARVLTGLGYEDGSLEIRLERAIAAVTAARQRRDGTERTAPQLRATIAEREVALQDGSSRGWTDLSALSGPPTDPGLLTARRNDVAELISEAGRPDLVGSTRRMEAAEQRIAGLQEALAALADGPAKVRGRLIKRALREISFGEGSETLPLIVDDTFAAAPLPLRVDLLDALVEIAEHTQVIMLTDDPTVSRWARQRAGRPAMTLYESEPAPDESETLMRAGPIDAAQLAVEADAWT